MSADFNPNISNGTCYYSEDKVTNGDLIPCGNVALGHWPCCYAGDICLGLDDANACWDASTGNTYLGGCTDSGFNSRACPWKSPEFTDQEWVAIQQCEAGTGHNDTQWGGCKTDANSTELEKLPHASCDPYCTTYIYEGTSAIPAFATLPDIVGESITWASGFNPTSVVAAVVTTTANVSGSEVTITSTRTGMPTQTSSSQAAPATDGGLSTTAKISIGAGVAGAAVIVIAMILLGCFFRRRRLHRNKETVSLPQQAQFYTIPAPGRGPAPESWSRRPQIDMSYGGFKFELPADPSTTPTHFKAELPAHDHQPPSAGWSAYSNHSSPHPSTASPYDTDWGSTLSEVNTVHGYSGRVISPQTTGEYQAYRPDINTHKPRISELQG